MVNRLIGTYPLHYTVSIFTPCYFGAVNPEGNHCLVGRWLVITGTLRRIKLPHRKSACRNTCHLYTIELLELWCPLVVCCYDGHAIRCVVYSWHACECIRGQRSICRGLVWWSRSSQHGGGSWVRKFC